MSHSKLDVEPERIAGLAIPNADGWSKNDRIAQALAGRSDVEVANLALKFASEWSDIALDEVAREVLEADEPPLTHITRRAVARVFGHDLMGEAALLETLDRYFDLFGPVDFGLVWGGTGSLRDRIQQHMVRNDDWSVEDLFGHLGAFQCSRARFAALLEETVHPLARSGDAQRQAVRDLNAVLVRDGYELAVEGEVSGHPLYRFRAISRGVDGRPKNLIFASRGPKPEIGFADAINNDIVILSGEDNCLVYDRPFGPSGLLWSDLVAWWSHVTGGDASSLGARLQESLASDGERTVFATYFKTYRAQFEGALPALLPQVYLHYDPGTVKALRHRLPLPRQRMDFLLLLPSRQRIVIEIDGKHHFAEGDRASLKNYADMVSADRELRLAGYEVYRFGANEVVGAGAQARITDFFDKLFRLHGLGGGN